MLQHIIFDAENGGFAEGYNLANGGGWSDWGRYFVYSDGCIHHHNGVDYTDVVSESGFFISPLIDLDVLPAKYTKLCVELSVKLYKYAYNYDDTLAAFGIRYASNGAPNEKGRHMINVRTDVVGGRPAIPSFSRTVVEMDLSTLTENQFYIVAYAYYTNPNIYKIYLEGEDPNDKKYAIYTSNLVPLADEVRRLTGTTDLLTVDEIITKLQSLTISSPTVASDFLTPMSIPDVTYEDFDVNLMETNIDITQTVVE